MSDQPQYPPPYQHPPFQQPPYQQGPSQPPPGWQPYDQGPTQDERNWALASHLGSFAAAYIALGFVAPLVVLLAKGSMSAFVREHAVESLNFQITAMIYFVVSAVLIFVLIGIPMLIVGGFFYLVSVILGTVAASAGRFYRYPLCIRFVH